LKHNTVGIHQYYEVPLDDRNEGISYEKASDELRNLLEDSVQQRLMADVPLGVFLSGGIDSSIIAALAAKHKQNLNTFSIGFKDEPMFDETYYAELVAKKLKTNHTAFSLTNNHLFEHLFEVLDYIDEPFADSSALNVFILSKETRKHATVALSGDGADELFTGYHKHLAECKARKGGVSASILKNTSALWEILPKSRNGKFSNLFRQLEKFSKGLSLSEKERYWSWASLMDEEDARNLLVNDDSVWGKEANVRKKEILKYITENGNYNEVLYTDVKLVLANDMLVKVDLMSMANSLEVRVPFLDYRLVDFAFSLPPEYKINGKMKKRILQDAFRSQLPAELYNRPKQGFEVPLLKWFQTELKSLIMDDLLAEKFILEQGIFVPEKIKSILQRLFSNNPGDAVANVWALIVFQYWWKKNMMS
ncbi:MAG: asparagine synthase, partial [Bacteroidetes bacterium]|nr:asparagine synthase [Bacteroidota bacterium]